MDTAQTATRTIDRNVMLLSVFLGLAIAALLTVRPWRHSQVAWGSDVGGALRTAKQTGRPVFVELYATWCGPCRQTERDTFSDAGVANKLATLSPVLLNYDNPAQRKQAEAWGAVALPSHILLRPDGEVQSLKFGYLSPEELTDWLLQSGVSFR